MTKSDVKFKLNRFWGYHKSSVKPPRAYYFQALLRGGGGAAGLKEGVTGARFLEGGVEVTGLLTAFSNNK